LDFKGKGFVTADDILQDRISFKLPLSKEVPIAQILITLHVGARKIHSYSDDISVKAKPNDGGIQKLFLR
jgi:hypothetical protein